MGLFLLMRRKVSKELVGKLLNVIIGSELQAGDFRGREIK
jgi:hypothetical protein